jgi:hypothetical protein
MKIYYKYELPRVTSCYHTLVSDEILTIVNENIEILA